MAASLAKSRKRAYQPSLAAYFPPAGRGGAASTSSPSTHLQATDPRVQSELLAVGMRVRKAVHDGYATKAPGKQGQWASYGAAADTPDSDGMDIDAEGEGDGWNSMPKGSQESNASAASTATNDSMDGGRRKRGFDSEDEEDDEEDGDENGGYDDGHGRTPGLHGHSQPPSRAQAQEGRGHGAGLGRARYKGQHGGHGGPAAGDAAADFGDAPFLVDARELGLS